jgi:hypothetical protein
MRFYLFNFCVGVLLCNNLYAQQEQIKVIRDSRIDALVEKQGRIVPPAIKPQMDGYRIQLFFDSSKDAVQEARSRFVSRFPTVDTYIEFNAPNFFLKVGDFRTRLDAEKIKVEVESEFPTSFIVQEKINLPRLERELE